MGYYLTLDDARFPESNYTDLSKVSFTIRQKSKKEVSDNAGFGSKFVTSFSGEITFYGEAYDYIYNKLIALRGNLAEHLGESISVKVYEDCCPDSEGNPFRIFSGKLSANSLKWCHDICEITGAIENDDSEISTICLKNKRIYDYDTEFKGEKFTTYTHNFIWYCADVRPSFLVDMLYAFYGLFVLIIAILSIFTLGLKIIIAVIVLIIALINTIADLLGFDRIDAIENIDFDSIGDVFNVQNTIIKSVAEFIHGCKKGHPSPYVRHYAEHVCNACGLAFKSSIFDDPLKPYYNSMYMYAPVSDGSETYIEWIDDNKPLLTGESFFSELSQVFNADYVIENNTLTFERKDYFYSNNNLFLDAKNGIDESLGILSICYSYPTTPPPAFANIKFTLDNVEIVGNEAKKDYSDLVDWNTEGNIIPEKYSRYKGEALYQIPYAPARFRKDGITRDTISFWEDYYQVFGILLFPVFALAGIDFGNFTPDDRFDRALLLSSGYASIPKLIVRDITIGNFDDAKAIRELDVFDPDQSVEHLKYNSPYYISGPAFSELDTNGVDNIPYKYTPVSNLYYYFEIDDPRKRLIQGLDYEIVITRKCDYLVPILDRSIFNKHIVLPLTYIDSNNQLVNTKGRIEEVEISGDRITIKGTL